MDRMLRRRRGPVRVAPARGQPRQLEEVREQRVPLLGGDALGMELHAMHGMRLVLQPHDDAVRRLGRDLEAVGQRLPLDDQRVVARHLERLGQALEDALARVA